MFKSLVRVLSMGSIILAIVLPVQAQVRIPRQPYRPLPPMGGAGLYGRVCTANRGGLLYLRAGPGRNFRAIRTIPNGRQLALFDREYREDGFWWWRVGYGGDVGWVRADFVCVSP